MKFDYKFKNCFGSVYSGGNVLFTSEHGSTLTCMAGHRLVCFDLKLNACHSVDAVSNHTLTHFDVSPNGLITVAVNEDGLASVISNLSGTLIRDFDFRAPVNVVKYSPDGTKIAVAKNDVVLVYHAPGAVAVYNPFKLYKLLTGSFGNVISLNWSSDGKLLLVGCDDATTRVFAADWIEGFSLYALGSHKSAVIGCFFTDDSSADCYTLSRDGSLNAWSCSKQLKDFKIYQRGQPLDSVEDELDESDAKLAQKAGSERFQDSSDVNEKSKMDVTYTRAGRFSVSTGSESVDITCADYHQGSKLMVIGMSDGQFHLYELPDFMQIQALSISSNFAITAAKINASGDWVAIASQSLGQLLVWEWQSESYIMKQQSHASKHVVTAAVFSPDEQFVVTGGNDSKVKLWQLKTSFCLVTFSEHTSTVTSVLFMQSGKAILSASLDGTIRAYDLKRYRNFKTLTSPRQAQFTNLCIDNSSDIVAACAVDIFEVFVWALQTGSVLEVVSGHTSVVTSCRFTPVTNLLITTSLDGFIRSWNIASAKGGGEFLTLGCEILALTVSPSGAEVAVSTSKANIHIIDLLIFEEKDQIQCRHDLGTGRGVMDQTTSKNLAKSQTFTSLSYSPDGLFLLAGGNSKYVCLYSVLQCLMVKKFTLSQNFSMDRMHELLDRRKMTEYGNKGLIDSENMEVDGKVKGKEIPLPGVKSVDLGERSFKPEMRCDQIEFSASGSSFVAATTEGCVLYSLDTDSLFDPYQLSTEISPESTRKLLEEKSFQLALIYSLKLNESKLIRFCVESVPMSSIESVVSSLPTVYVFKLVNFLVPQISVSPLVEFYTTWCKSVLLFHRNSIKDLMPKKDLVTFNKAIISRYEELRSICDPVGGLLDYYLAIARLNRVGIGNDADGEANDGNQSDSDSGLSDMVAESAAS